MRAESRDAVVSYAYDRAGRVTEEWQELLGAADGGDVAGVERGPLAVRHGHDARGRLAATALPDGREIAVEYGADDASGWAAVALDGEALARVERDEVGREVARTAGAVRQTQAYDPQGRLARQQGTGRGGAAVFRRQYGYDAADQIVRLEDAARGPKTYEYDACERLLAVGGSSPERFVVDPAGNILARDAAGDAGNAAPGDRLMRYRDGAEERTFAYDAWGNRVGERRATKGGGAVEVAYAYDAGDTLREVRTTDRPGGRATTRVTRFGYDALGRRVWKAAARLCAAAALADTGAGASQDAATAEPPDNAWTRTAFVWSGDVLAGESDRLEGDPLATAYVYEPGTFRPLALVKHAGGAAAGYRYHVDHLGTPQELTGEDGRVAWRANDGVWGVAQGQVREAVAQPLRFPGQYADAETGLHYNRHRYYSPGEGRFITQDPIGLAGGMNLSAYPFNPVELSDPLGLNPLVPNMLPSPFVGRSNAHHIIPQQLMNDPQLGPMLRDATRGGWDVHGRDNGVWLPSTDTESIGSNLPAHRGSHPRYTAHVAGELDPVLTNYRAGNYNGQLGVLADDVRQVGAGLRSDLQSGTYKLHETDPVPTRCAF